MSEESDIPNEKEQKRLTEAYKRIHKQVLYLVQEHQGIHEGFITFLLCLSSENLEKHSKHLTWLTVGLLITSVALIGLTIALLCRM